jgi:hypothetical protein
VFPVAGAFAAKTIPWVQWPVWRQYTQIGVVLLTVIVHVGKVVALAATGMNPESNPTCPVVLVDASSAHGAAKELCVAVWFFCWNSNVIVSPGCAVMLLGE